MGACGLPAVGGLAALGGVGDAAGVLDVGEAALDQLVVGRAEREAPQPVAARLAGVENVYKCGGAQGIAAVAFLPYSVSNFGP